MVYGEYVQHPQVKAAKMLTELLPEPLDAVYFTNSGSEAVEAAMKLAKRATGRTEIVAMENAYHGSTQGALSLMGNPTSAMRTASLLPGIRHIGFNRIDQLQQITTDTAAVFCETVQGEAGAIVPDAAWLQALRRRCSEKPARYWYWIEIQAGMGRTSTFSAFEAYGIVPDVLSPAKGLGGGMPIGAVVAEKALLNHFTHNPVLGHITTFGGHPVSCVAALATLRHIYKNRLWENAAAMEQLFRQNLVHPAIEGVAGQRPAVGPAVQR